jgi:hypothetical protein
LAPVIVPPAPMRPACPSERRAGYIGAGFTLGVVAGIVYGARRGDRGLTFDTGGALKYGIVGGAGGALIGWALYRATGAGCDRR